MTALEGGLTTESTRRSTRSGSGTAGVGMKFIHASGERSRENEESRTLPDTDEARFDRLLRAADAEPEALGWVDVIQPDTDLDGVGIGAMVSWECDLYIPEIIQRLARSGEALGALDMMRNLLPMARRFTAAGTCCDSGGEPVATPTTCRSGGSARLPVGIAEPIAEREQPAPQGGVHPRQHGRADPVPGRSVDSSRFRGRRHGTIGG